LTPEEPGMAAGIISFRLACRGIPADNNAIVAQLRDQFDVFTVRSAATSV